MMRYKYSVIGLVLAEIVFAVTIVACALVLEEFAPHIEWHRGYWWWGLTVIPVITVAYLIHLRWKVKAVERLADHHLLNGVISGFSVGRQSWRFFIWRVAFAFGVLALLGPKVGSKLVEIESKGSDIIIAIDVSNSMMAEDLGPPRLEIAHQTVNRILSKLGSDRVGIVVFAGDAFVQCPLTSDYTSLKIFLNTVSTSLISSQGTAIGNAIDVGMKAFENAPANGRAIVVITDGENHEDDPVAAAAAALDAGTTVHVMGLASTEGGPIPRFNRNGKKIGFKEDSSGQPVVSKLDESTLLSTAQAGGGVFTKASNSYLDITPTINAINKLEKSKSTDLRFTDYDHKFQYLAILCIALLIIESVIPNPRIKA